VSTPLPRTILVVGAGGREHALVRALAAAPSHPRVYCAPGNAGIAADATCFNVPADDIPALEALALRERAEFVVVGPETPLTLGLVDRLAAAGIPAFGPKADGARLEASKIFSKELLIRRGIPTAGAAIFTESGPALAHVRAGPLPVVIKADGLAAGKGVVVAQTRAEAEGTVVDMLVNGRFGDAGRSILVEECLQGEETSLLVVVSGRSFIVLPTAQDHKRVGDGDTGPNTGGMGAYSPAEVVTPALLEQVEREIVRPSVEAIADEGIDFRGILFIGLMLTAAGPRVLEYNTRFGDPETQAILPRLSTDLLTLLWAAAKGELDNFRLEVRPQPAICVVISARGYPGEFPKRDPIAFPDHLPPGVSILHAGTARDGQGRVVSAGGRVLNVVASGSSLREAADKAYATCARVDYPAKYYRSDIGGRALKRT